MPIEFDPGPLAKLDRRLDDMVKQLEAFGNHFGDILSDWQTEDIHRKRAFTLKWGKRVHKAQTTVRPHSLHEMLGEHAYQRIVLHTPNVKRGHIRRRYRGRVYRRTSTRPILRSGLLELLQARLNEALARLKW
ncbi:MAG TPA: hypothetical protein VGH47_04485 [Xanthobacteraceae bacterium]|jgi:hypothetical protein